MLLYWEILCKKRFRRKIEKEDADQDIGVSSVGKASSSKIERKDYLHKQSFSLCCLSSIYTGKEYDSELFRIFFGSQAD